MIDHVSVGVRDLASATVFYEQLLAVLGHQKLADEPGTVGFGKKYPEFWLNSRPEKIAPDADQGCHICLRASGTEVVDAFYRKAMALGASSSGEPGLRPHYHESYYACFIKDTDGNHIELVTFVSQ